MPSRQKSLGVALAIVALTLTGVGVFIAASDANSAASRDAALALHGNNPTSARLALTISTGQRYDVTGTLDFNFVNNRAQATLAIPTVFSTTTVRAVLAGHELYVGSSALNSVVKKSWTAIPITSAFELFPIEGEMAKIRIDIPLLRKLPGLNLLTTERITHDGPFTTFTLSKTHLRLASTPAKGSMIPQFANVSVAVTVASAGQLADLAVTATSSTLNVSIDAKVLSYNSPVAIDVPASGQVQPLNAVLIRRLFAAKSSPLAQLLSAQQLAQLRSLISR